MRNSRYAAEELSEGKFINIKKESGYKNSNNKNEDVPEVTQAKKFHNNGTFDDILQHECAKDKMLEAEPNLGRRITIP